MFGGLRLNERQQAFVLLRRAQELEGDAALADGAHHRGDFERRLVSPGSDFKIKNIVNPHVSLALDDAAAHREVEHRPLAADFSTGKGKKQPHGYPKVLTTVDRMSRLIQSNPRRQEAATALRTRKRGQEEDRCQPLTGR